MNNAKSAALFAGMMTMLHGSGFPTTRTNDDPLTGIDIEKEHELIQQKKSKLTARLRGMVEFRYNRRRQQ